MKKVSRIKGICKVCSGKKMIDKLRFCSQCRLESTITYWRGKLWDAVRKFVYDRDESICFTCGKYVDGSNRHCGHFLTGASCPVSLYFEITNLHVQCMYCNIHLSGYWVEYERRMISLYGKAHVTKLKKRQKIEQGVHWDIARYKKELKKYDR